MPESNRHTNSPSGKLVVLTAIIAGMVVTLAVAGMLVMQERHDARERESPSSYQTESARGEIQATCVQDARSRAYRCTADIPIADQHDPYAEYDLKAQQDMARQAYAMVLIGLGSLLMTGIALVLLWWTLEATREAVQAATGANAAFGEHSQKELRAYVGVESARVTFENDFASMTALVVVKNFGATPARHVYFESKLDWFEGIEPELPVISLPDRYEDIMSMEIPPGQPLEIPFKCDYPEPEKTRKAKQAKGELSGLAVKHARLFYFGVVFYRTYDLKPDDPPRETHFVYMVPEPTFQIGTRKMEIHHKGNYST